MGLIHCPSCGQKQSDENTTCINCGVVLRLPAASNRMSRTEIVCPHCGRIQDHTVEQCENCGKSMRTAFKIRKKDVIGALISFCALAFGIYFTMEVEISIGIGIIVLSALFALVKSCEVIVTVQNSGLLLDRANAERLYREALPTAGFIHFDGIPGLENKSASMLLDRNRKQLIFVCPGSEPIERFLPFEQIISFGVVKRVVTGEGNPFLGAAIGGAFGGKTGAVVGAIAAKGEKRYYPKYFEINYRTKSGYVGKIECLYQGVTQDKLDKISMEFRQAIGQEKHLNAPPPPAPKSDYL